MREIICISSGDSKRISTWSGVPYFHTSELEKMGWIIHRADIGLPGWKLNLWDKTFRRAMKIICRHNMLDAYKSFLSYFLLTYTVFSQTIRHKNAEAVLIYGFPPFWSKVTRLPVVYLGDWPFSYFIEEKLRRSPDFFERRYIAKEVSGLNKSVLAVSLFQNCAEYMKRVCSSSTNIQHIEGNVINCPQTPDESVISKKLERKRILFVGRNHYLKGLELLIDALPIIRQMYPDVVLDVIGISEELVSDRQVVDVVFHGYLHKEVPEECARFYELLSEASVIVNPNPEWAGYSSLIEAMYYYTPVVVSSFESFVRDFGPEIDFGKYCTQQDVAETVLSVLSSVKYTTMCYSAHERVKEFTWENYTKKFIQLLDKSISEK